MEAQRALLDQLLGADRNLVPEESEKMKHKWKKRENCQYFLCGFCPYELLISTKGSIGTCSLVHEFNMQKSFSDEPIEVQKPNLVRFRRFLQRLLEELEDRIEKGKMRCEKKKNENGMPTDNDERDQKLQEITINIDQLLRRIEELAEDGKVEESKALVAEIDSLNEEKRELLSDETTLRIDADTRDKKLTVCDTCGAFLIVDEATGRLESHIEGRQHNGYLLIREKLQELNKINFDEIKSVSVSPPRNKSPRKRSHSRNHHSRKKRHRHRSRSPSDRDRRRTHSNRRRRHKN